MNEKRRKLLVILLLLSFQFLYLEWAGGNKMFVFNVEADLIANLKSKYKSFAHPFIFVPILGNLLLLISLVNKRYKILLTVLGIAGLGVLGIMILLISVISWNSKMLSAVFPFVIFTYLLLRYLLQLRKASCNIS